MNSRFILNASKCTHYINENEGWKKMLDLEISEMPILNNMLSSVTIENKTSIGENRDGRQHFITQLTQQQKDMDQLNKEIENQQNKLYQDLENESDSAYDINTYCSEDILRERIRAIEKNYIELKSDFMKYMSSVM